MLCGRDEWWWCYIIMWLSLSLLLTALWQAHTEKKKAHTLRDLCQEQAWFINCWNPRWRVPTQSIGNAATARSFLGLCDVEKKRHTNTHISAPQACRVYCITLLMGNGSSPVFCCQLEAEGINFHQGCQGHHSCLVWFKISLIVTEYFSIINSTCFHSKALIWRHATA